MYKIFNAGHCRKPIFYSFKFLVIMKTTILLSIVFTQIAIASHGQQVSLRVKNVPATQVIYQLSKQSGYDFIYDAKLMERVAPMTINMNNVSLKEALEQCFAEEPFEFFFNEDKTVIIRPRPSNPVTLVVQEPVTGVVRDSSGNPLQGVSVLVRGTQRGAATDVNGRFQIQADEGYILIFRNMGYTLQEVKVGSQTVLDIVLLPETAGLDEVVVIGYGTVRKGDLTGSVAQVKAKEINAFPNANVIQSLSGRAAGVQIRPSSGAPGPAMSVRIRGGNSLQGSNEPLYVIDGFPISGDTPNPTHVNTADIESIEILKDASATAIYGSRGANGVVLITTKRGKEGATSVDFETSYGTQSAIKRLDLMNANEYARFYNIHASNIGAAPHFTDQEVAAYGEGYDWQDLLFSRAPMGTAALTIAGGTEKTQFSVAGSYFGQEGIINGSDYSRYSLRTNLNHKISDRFRVELTSTLSRLQTSRRDNGGGNRGSSMFGAAIAMPSTLTPYEEDGSYTIPLNHLPFVASELRNPINFINEQFSTTRANVALVNAAISYNITPELILKIAGGIENRDDRTDNYTTTKFFGSQGAASISTLQQMSLLNENTLNYNRTFGEKHHVSAVAGFTYQDFVSTPVGVSGNIFLSDIMQTYDLGAAQGIPLAPSSNYVKSVLLSYLGRINYNYDDRYLATFSIRRDGSSRYSAGHQWGNFPSAAFAWRISNESFMAGQNVFSDLKLRASWGLTGSQAIDAYTTQNLLVSNRIILGDQYHNTFAPAAVFPGILWWESTEQMDLGLDAAFLNNRILLTADLYVKNTRDLLSPVGLPASMGYTSTIQNVGKVQNRGLELGLEGDVIRGPFVWNLNGNIAFNRNKVVSLYNGEDILRDRIGVAIVNDFTSILREGRPVGQFWGYMEDGYNENGQIRYMDLDGNGAINAADKTYIGDPNPDFIYGLNSTMTYKNFELNVFFQGVSGNDIFNASSIVTVDYGFGLNMPREVLYNHWTPENPNAKYPRISNSVNANISDRFIEDGSYLRLKNIMLAYNVPVQSFGIRWARSLNVYVSGQNLWTLTNYSWWDPESNFRLDYNGYPIAKTVTFGLRAGF